MSFDPSANNPSTEESPFLKVELMDPAEALDWMVEALQEIAKLEGTDGWRATFSKLIAQDALDRLR